MRIGNAFLDPWTPVVTVLFLFVIAHFMVWEWVNRVGSRHGMRPLDAYDDGAEGLDPDHVTVAGNPGPAWWDALAAPEHDRFGDPDRVWTAPDPVWADVTEGGEARG